jgi:hypothetical protein
VWLKDNLTIWSYPFGFLVVDVQRGPIEVFVRYVDAFHFVEGEAPPSVDLTALVTEGGDEL